MGISNGAEALDGVKGLIIFGEDPVWADLSDLEFLMVSDVFMTKTGAKADVFIPATGSASAFGTYTNTERRLIPVEPAIEEDVDLLNWEIAAELAHIFEEDFMFETEVDISAEMDDVLPLYKYSEIGEIIGGTLSPAVRKFVDVKSGKLVDELPCTDALMNINSDRIPKPAE